VAVSKRTDVEIYYELRGPSWGEPLVMIHGLGAQLIDWHPDLVAGLESAGFRLIMLDNRDQGRSGDSDPHTQYAIADMAADTRGVLDELAIERAHFIGISMGALISQEFAVSYPERTLSQLLMCTMCAPRFDRVAAAVAAGQASRPIDPGAPREEYVELLAQQRFKTSGTGLSLDWVRRAAAASYDRAHRPTGVARQLHAVRTYGDRLTELATTAAVTTIFHGRDDAVVDVEGAIALARAIPGADLHMYGGVGHEVPPFLWPDIIRMLERNVQRSKHLATKP
jgi:pimeloyl-ACP methyl ester carboxylesterase